MRHAPWRAIASFSNVATLACVAKNLIRGAKMSDSLLSLTATVKACKFWAIASPAQQGRY